MSTENVYIKQKLWAWKVVVHLFLVGLAAGTYITGSLLNIMNPSTDFVLGAKIATSAAIPLLIIGVIFVFIHLGKIANVRRAFLRPGSSWLARGSIALLAFLVIDLVQFALWLWPSTNLEGMPGLNAVLQIINSLIALFVLIYSGMLLTTLKSFPFWHVWSLPLMFTISGLTSGLMFLILLSAVLDTFTGNAIITMLSWNNFLLVILALALILFLWRGKAVSGVKNSVRIMSRVYGVEFYLGVVTAGLLIPFFLGIFIVFLGSSSAAILPLLIVFTILGLIGGYTLKELVLKSGTSTGINLPAETVPLPETSRSPASERVHYR